MVSFYKLDANSICTVIFKKYGKELFTPAQSSLVQGVLTRDDYTTAVGLNQMVTSLFMLFGSGIGIYCYWVIGIYGAILIDAISFY